MSHETEPHHMAVADLAHRCAQETQHYFRQQHNDTSYCFELFRRAVQEGDQAAWDIICIQYQPLVSGWVKKHRAFEASGEEVQYFVNGVFGKISRTITPAKFSHFPDIGSLLGYLKMCVHSVISDHNRTMVQADLFPIDDISEEPSTDPAPEQQVMDRSARQSFGECIDERLYDDKERAVVYGSYGLGLKPQELYTHFRNLFTDVDEVYQVKQNVIARLRRDPEVRKLLGEHDGN